VRSHRGVSADLQSLPRDAAAMIDSLTGVLGESRGDGLVV